jgi:hypothetical protein
MSKIYTFVIPYSGTMSVWTDADSEEEARAKIMEGDWWDSSEETFESHPEKSIVLVETEDIKEGEFTE